MIASNLFEQNTYRSVFHIKNNTLRLIEYNPVIDLTQPDHPDLFLPLPKELIYAIIDRVILQLIGGSNFEQAFQLICLDKATMFRFYRQHIDQDPFIYFKTVLHRLTNTFELLQKVLDGIVQFPNEEHDHYIALDIQYKSRQKYLHGRSYNPWNFNGHINIIQIPKPGIFGIEDFRAFITGPYITDIVWMNGKSDRGIVRSSFFRLPVIVFILTDHEENIIPTKENLEKHVAFKNFSKLLKRAFGPHTGIFFAVQGVYIFDDQILVEM